MIETVRLSDITTDATAQARVETDARTVAAYAEDMRSGSEFPPPVLFRDEDGTLRIGDGCHRVQAAILAGVVRIAADVHEGDHRAAVLYSIRSNARHGKPFTNADKRRAVGLMLDDEELGKLPDREIARQCGVSQPFVGKLRAARRDNGYQEESPLGPHMDAPMTQKEREERDRLVREFHEPTDRMIEEILSLRLSLGAEKFASLLEPGDHVSEWFRMAFEMYPRLAEEPPAASAAEVKAWNRGRNAAPDAAVSSCSPIGSDAARKPAA